MCPICLLVILLIIFIIKICLTKSPSPIFGIYQQKGKFYFIKYCAFYLLLKYRKWQSQKTGEQYHLTDKDKALVLSEHPKGFDAVFYVGVNSDGFMFVFGTERRHRGLVHAVLYIVIPGRGLFTLPCVPDTILFSNRNGEDETNFTVQGLSNFPIKPLSKWKLKYNGYLKQEDKLYYTELDFDWQSNFKCFDFEMDLSTKAIASSIALETWSRNYFECLKNAHQLRYEQMGIVKGTVKIDLEVHTLELMSFRDHSFGMKRDWSLMHRYGYFLLFLKDGSSLSLGIICQPCTGSVLTVGYICSANGIMEPIDSCNLQLYQHGEGGSPPTDHSFQFETSHKTYTVQISVLHFSVHHVGSNWEARMVERFVKCQVNSINGYGISEFHYHNDKGRPSSFAENDPAWFKELTSKAKNL